MPNERRYKAGDKVYVTVARTATFGQDDNVGYVHTPENAIGEVQGPHDSYRYVVEFRLGVNISVAQLGIGPVGECPQPCIMAVYDNIPEEYLEPYDVEEKFGQG